MASENNIHTYDGIQEDRERKPPGYFNLLYYGLIIWGVAFCAYFLLSGWSSHEEFKDKMAAHQQQAAGSMTLPASPGK